MKRLLILLWLPFFLLSCSKDNSSSPAGGNCLLPMIQNSKWGYIDELGNKKINPQFDFAGNFTDDLLAKIRIGTYYGYINKSGNSVITAKYDSAGNFNCERAAVWKYGEPKYIDKTGKEIWSPFTNFDLVRMAYTEDLVAVGTASSGIKYGFADKNGTLVIPTKYDYAMSFSQGLSCVTINGKDGYIDKNGNYVINPQFDLALSFHEGLAAVKQNGKWGFIDNTGKWVITAQFDDAFGFSEGLASIKKSSKWGYIDKSGTIVIQPQFSNTPGDFHDGMAWIYDGYDYGFINLSGTTVVSPKYYAAFNFCYGVAMVVDISKGFGYIDKTGKFIWQPQMVNLKKGDAPLSNFNYEMDRKQNKKLEYEIKK
jgi:hypothetical protein